MDGILLGLLIGLIVGALGCYLLARRRQQQLQDELGDAAERLSEANAALAAAEAESRLLSAQSQQDSSVLKALHPVAERLSDVQRQVALLERDRVEQYGQLAQQLQDAKAADALLLQTTHSLASTLRSTSARGRWGEVQLRRVVEAAGLLSHVDFSEQVQHSGEEGTQRPDMVVQLPAGKELILDAKVPLSAFLEAQETTDEALAANALQRHAKAVRSHVDALAAKKYWHGSTASPEVVICFLPAESILSVALNSDAQLLDYSLSKGVVLASPVSLLAVLKAVAFSWRQDVLTESARELFETSNQLYERLAKLGEHVEKLGGSIKSSVDKYNALVGSLEGRVLPTARKLNALDPETLSSPSLLNTQPRSLSAPELLEREETRHGGS
ncbi:DNA recombination protein RmuC [Psychromicrobium lacuslunae]|uniref:Recombinase RmuC n=1 Tax=Psychromicrobium lacuslunae TaxID=1618207 RepID=A0A0D4BYT0_9MICC|nr:DNA recombination protein RmuC [Psychromicrobium lacuslunae]AJT41582.1 recombinase RmuC [Psychromicrobium lacuslunae]